MINLAKIEHTPTMNIATSTAIGERFVTEEVAYCRYHFDGMCVFKTDTDGYYSLPMSDAELSAFVYNDPELVAELEPMDESYSESLQVIEDDNAKVAYLGLALIKTITPADSDPLFLLYDPETQVHFLFSQVDFERLSEDVVTKLKTMGLAVTWTNRPYRVHLDDDGLVCRAEAVSL